MVTKLEILSQVMLSLKVEQGNIMQNINALLNNRETEFNLIEKIKIELGSLSSVNSKMQECEGFMLQIAQSTIKTNPVSVDDNKIGSDGDSEKTHSEK
ncbi:MAG: hypothetical protein AABY15_08945 [Nanoarchaeota archaeon]